MTISVPDDTAAHLQSRGKDSAAVTEAVRRVPPDARRARQRSAAQAFGAYQRGRDAQQIEADRILIESNNDIALRDSEW